MTEEKKRFIGYFSMEIGLDTHIPTYAGGLGILSGDTLKSCADLHIPVVATTLLTKEGYFYQRLLADGWQEERPVQWSVDDFLTQLPDTVTITLKGRTVAVKAWQTFIKGFDNFKIPVLFLDTDLEENAPEDREITKRLYGGDNEYRLMQEAVLGIAGVLMLRKRGYDIRKYHMNEGHSALLTLELFNEYKDTEMVRERCVFTTHTPVPAGHDRFPLPLTTSILGDLPKEVMNHVVRDDMLNMTWLAMHFSKHVNGVAKKHGEVSRAMFPGYEIDAITNGVHSVTWTSESFKKLFDTHVPSWRKDPFSLRGVFGLTKKEVWAAHFEAKKKLINEVNERENAGLDHDHFTIGFARRMTAYKRPDLLFSDIDRLVRINDTIGKVQIIYAGKAHPKDTNGKELIKRIFSIKEQLKGRVTIAFIENYDIALAQLLVAGVDLWLNTPLRPLEASGTSGMKAAHNGVPSLSVLDGWWLEGWLEDITGWSIGLKPHKSEPEKPADSMRDAQDLYDKLENRILPLFYQDRDEWIRKMRSAIAINASFFNTHRMVQQYVTNAYFT